LKIEVIRTYLRSARQKVNDPAKKKKE